MSEVQAIRRLVLKFGSIFQTRLGENIEEDEDFGFLKAREASGEECVDIGVLYSHPLDKARKPVHYEEDIANIIDILRVNPTEISLSIKPATIMNLRKMSAKVLIILCHGDYSENGEFFLHFEKEQGQLLKLTRQMLKEETASGRFSATQMVYVAACHSEEVAECFQEIGVPIVVYTHQNLALDESAAHFFTKTLIQMLASDYTYREAFKRAQTAVYSSQVSRVSHACCCGHRHSLSCSWKKKWLMNPDSAHSEHFLNSCACDIKKFEGLHDSSCEILLNFQKKYNEKSGPASFESGNDPTQSELLSRRQTSTSDWTQKRETSLFQRPSFEKQFLCCCPEFSGGHDPQRQFQIHFKSEEKLDKKPFGNSHRKRASSTTLLEAQRLHSESFREVKGRSDDLLSALHLILKEKVRFIKISGEKFSGKTTFVKCLATYLQQRGHIEKFHYKSMLHDSPSTALQCLDSINSNDLVIFDDANSLQESSTPSICQSTFAEKMQHFGSYPIVILVVQSKNETPFLDQSFSTDQSAPVQSAVPAAETEKIKAIFLKFTNIKLPSLPLSTLAEIFFERAKMRFPELNFSYVYNQFSQRKNYWKSLELVIAAASEAQESSSLLCLNESLENHTQAWEPLAFITMFPEKVPELLLERLEHCGVIGFDWVVRLKQEQRVIVSGQKTRNNNLNGSLPSNFKPVSILYNSQLDESNTSDSGQVLGSIVGQATASMNRSTSHSVLSRKGHIPIPEVCETMEFEGKNNEFQFDGESVGDEVKSSSKGNYYMDQSIRGSTRGVESIGLFGGELVSRHKRSFSGGEIPFSDRIDSEGPNPIFNESMVASREVLMLTSKYSPVHLREILEKGEDLLSLSAFKKFLKTIALISQDSIECGLRVGQYSIGEAGFPECLPFASPNTVDEYWTISPVQPERQFRSFSFAELDKEDPEGLLEFYCDVIREAPISQGLLGLFESKRHLDNETATLLSQALPFSLGMLKVWVDLGKPEKKLSRLRFIHDLALRWISILVTHEEPSLMNLTEHLSLIAFSVYPVGEESLLLKSSVRSQLSSYYKVSRALLLSEKNIKSTWTPSNEITKQDYQLVELALQDTQVLMMEVASIEPFPHSLSCFIELRCYSLELTLQELSPLKKMEKAAVLNSEKMRFCIKNMKLPAFTNGLHMYTEGLLKSLSLFYSSFGEKEEQDFSKFLENTTKDLGSSSYAPSPLDFLAQRHCSFNLRLEHARRKIFTILYQPPLSLNSHSGPSRSSGIDIIGHSPDRLAKGISSDIESALMKCNQNVLIRKSECLRENLMNYLRGNLGARILGVFLGIGSPDRIWLDEPVLLDEIKREIIDYSQSTEIVLLLSPFLSHRKIFWGVPVVYVQWTIIEKSDRGSFIEWFRAFAVELFRCVVYFPYELKITEEVVEKLVERAKREMTVPKDCSENERELFELAISITIQDE